MEDIHTVGTYIITHEDSRDHSPYPNYHKCWLFIFGKGTAFVPFLVLFPSFSLVLTISFSTATRLRALEECVQSTKTASNINSWKEGLKIIIKKFQSLMLQSIKTSALNVLDGINYSFREWERNSESLSGVIKSEKNSIIHQFNARYFFK